MLSVCEDELMKKRKTKFIFVVSISFHLIKYSVPSFCVRNDSTYFEYKLCGNLNLDKSTNFAVELLLIFLLKLWPQKGLLMT